MLPRDAGTCDIRAMVRRRKFRLWGTIEGEGCLQHPTLH
ncbi:hypothetical protein Z946_3484 [Sulfitobacter noctilucicola]|nr:hypothetical protein Z946_3484 [Sulfitobacter noctilucicola]